jgi:hypothetical protein
VRQQVNLYQPIFRKQEKKFSARAMLQAIAAVFAGVVLLYGWTQWQVRGLKDELRRAEQQQATVAKRLNDVTAQFSGRRTVQSVDEEIARLEKQLAARQRVREILSRGIFGNTQGFSEYFAAFARHPMPGLWLTGFDIVGAAEQMTLQGRTTNPEAVPRYVQRLAAEPKLTGIEFQVFQLARPAPAGKTAAAYVDFMLKTAGAPEVKTP